MNRKIVVLNIVLLALLVWLGVQLRARWMDAKAREQAALSRTPQPGQPLPPPPVPGVEPASPAAYIEVAQKTLFAKDRDPNVVLEVAPPPPPPPEPPVPPLPAYHGQMAFGDPVIVLSAEGRQKSYHVGEKVGEFTIAAFDRETVTFEWREKTLKHELRELLAKEPTRPAPPPPQAAAAAAPAGANVAKIGGGSSEEKTDPTFGKQLGSYRLCNPNDTSPDGTIKDGYRKVIIPGMMGTTCQWEPIR